MLTYMNGPGLSFQPSVGTLIRNAMHKEQETKLPHLAEQSQGATQAAITLSMMRADT